MSAERGDEDTPTRPLVDCDWPGLLHADSCQGTESRVQSGELRLPAQGHHHQVQEGHRGAGGQLSLSRHRPGLPGPRTFITCAYSLARLACQRFEQF